MALVDVCFCRTFNSILDYHALAPGTGQGYYELFQFYIRLSQLQGAEATESITGSFQFYIRLSATGRQ